MSKRIVVGVKELAAPPAIGLFIVLAQSGNVEQGASAIIVGEGVLRAVTGELAVQKDTTRVIFARDDLSPLDIPKDDIAIIASREDRRRVAWVRFDRINFAVVTLEHADLLARVRVVDLDIARGRGNDTQTVVRIPENHGDLGLQIKWDVFLSLRGSGSGGRLCPRRERAR